MTLPPAPADPTSTTPKRRKPATAWVMLGLAVVVLLVGLAGGGFQSKLGDVQKNDNSSFLPGSADSTKVANAAGDFSSVQSIPGTIVVSADDGTLSQADLRTITGMVTQLAKINGVAGEQVRPFGVSKDGKVAALSVPLIGKEKVDGKTITKKGPQLVDTEKAVIQKAKQLAPPGTTVHSAGAGGLLAAFIDAFDGLDGALLLFAGIVVIVILLFVYRSPVLWFFPLFSAALALGAASIVIYALAKNDVITLNGQSQGILSVLVIGAGTDYALLLVSRYREELHTYESRYEAMVAAWKGAAPPILASAVTVILGLICLTFAELNSTSGLGPVCAIGIACTVVVMLVLLPVLLVLAGRWIFWPRRPLPDHQVDVESTHGVWSRIAGGVERRHRASWIGAVILLGICIGFIGTLRTDGLQTKDQFTSKPDAVKGQAIYDAAFPQAQGAGAPAQILLDASSSSDPRVTKVIAAARSVHGVETGATGVCVSVDYGAVADKIKADPSAAAVLAQRLQATCPQDLGVAVAPHDGRLLIDAQLTSSYDSDAAFATVRALRKAVGAVPDAHALVGGQAAANLDVQDASRHDRNLIIPLTLLVILVVLGIVLRALVAPILLIATVVLSFAASLGVSALVFNHVFHFANADPAFPLFAFVFLVALGIDYNIFLMTRVREESLQHGTRRGIVRGLTVTGGVITSAGVVLAATFVVLGVLPIVFLAEIGFAVAFGVLLDTILVRSVLVPALALELGKKIWWPSTLAGASAAD